MLLVIDRHCAKVLAALSAQALEPLLRRSDAAVSPPVAAALVGRSPGAVCGAVDRAELPAKGGIHRHIRLVDLAKWAGVGSFTAAVFSAALRRVSDDRHG